MREPEVLAVLAIDWSGALGAAAQRRGIQVAECGPDGAARVTGGRLRGEVEEVLLSIAQAPDGPGRAVVAGLDFSFSFPAWFLRELGCGSGPELWERVAVEGEEWLRGPHAYFWGRRLTGAQGGAVGRRPEGFGVPELRGYRACELAAAEGGRVPLSSFQIGGAGAVGTGTLRGMPMLARLRAAGWSVWPFDEARLPMLVEIYPRLLTGPVVKSSREARVAYLGQARFAGLSGQARLAATESEDAFDALVSVLGMWEHRSEFVRLPRAGMELEGAIWRPGLSAG